MHGEAVLDLDALRETAGAEPARQRELLGRYLATADDLLPRLRALVVRDVAQDWDAATQRLDAAATAIHARQMALACQRAGRMADNAFLRLNAYLHVKHSHETLLVRIRAANL